MITRTEAYIAVWDPKENRTKRLEALSVPNYERKNKPPNFRLIATNGDGYIELYEDEVERIIEVWNKCKGV